MSNILFVFEGPKKEKQVADSIAKYFPNDNLVIHCAYCTTIYNLYNKISQDEDLDTFSLLKEIPFNKETLEQYNRTDFAEVYLFFDYDGHSSSADDKKLFDILELFSEETEFGKIFINYPMLESLKHYSDNVEFKGAKVKAKENIDYKKLVNRECNKDLIDFNNYTKEIWKLLIEIHLKKMNFIVTEDYSLPEDYILQKDIFSQQLEKYINIDSTIAVLNSFPIFLYEYYGKEYIVEFLLCEA